MAEDMGQRIQDLMGLVKMSPAGLADRLQVSVATVDRWIDGSREPGYLNGLRLARQLGVNPWFLAFGEGEKKWPGSLELHSGGSTKETAAPRADLTKLAAQIDGLIQETRRLNKRLKTVEARTAAEPARRRRGQPRG
jgi:transcriptional regulator with XRE-family HTH domain